MRLLIVNYEYPPVGAGAGNASWSLAQTLSQRGHQVSVITSAFCEYRGANVEAGVRVHRIPAGRRRLDRSTKWQMLRFAASGLVFAPRVVRTENPEQVIAFFTIPSGIVAYWLKALYRLPYVISLRGGDVPDLVPELNLIHHRLAWLRRTILGSARAVVANSKALAELSARVDPFRVEVIPNGVDSTMFRPPDLEPSLDPDSPLRILFAGRLQTQKNLELLLDELARLSSEGRIGFRLHVAGDGPLGESLHQQAERLEIGRHIVWHCWVEKPALITLYQNVDCFVNPSLYEGLPNTVLEAMACGLPVIASRVPGHDALVLEGETGFLFALEEPMQLGRALGKILRDRAAARRLGAKGRVRVHEMFSWDAVTTQYLDLLERGRHGPELHLSL